MDFLHGGVGRRRRGGCPRHLGSQLMKPAIWLCLLLAAPLACIELSAPSDGPAPIRTDAAEYQLQAGPTGYTATIDFVFTNPRQASVYVVNCNGIAPPTLEKFVHGAWVRAWS